MSQSLTCRHRITDGGARQTQSPQPGPAQAGDPLLLIYAYLLQRALERQAAEAEEVQA